MEIFCSPSIISSFFSAAFASFLLKHSYEGSAIPNYISITQFILIVFYLVFRFVSFSVAHRCPFTRFLFDAANQTFLVQNAHRHQNHFVYNFNCNNKPFYSPDCLDFRLQPFFTCCSNNFFYLLSHPIPFVNG